MNYEGSAGKIKNDNMASEKFYQFLLDAFTCMEQALADDGSIYSLSAQVSYYNDLIQKEDGWEFVGVYSDEAVTGTKEDRAGFQQMLEDCRNGKIDMVLTKSISRFARNTVTILETVRMLKALEVDVFFEEQSIHALVAQVVKNPMDIKKIIADEGNTLHFHLADGSVVTRIWADRSRVESWTAEKREAARQQAYERRQTKWQKQ